MDTIKDKMWEEHKKNSFGMQVICKKCGGSSASYCACAEHAFKKNLTQRDIDNFLFSREGDQLP